MDLLLIPLVAIIVLVAELPDKSMFASLVLGTRFNPRWVFLGVASAFVIHVVIAVLAGSLLTLLPGHVLEFVVAVLFLLGALYLWWSSRGGDEEADEVGEASTGQATKLTAYATSFVVIFIGEWGDITQILTANLAAKYDSPVLVGIGAVIGLWAAAVIAITAGQTLLRYISITMLQRIGALILLAFGIYSLVQAV